MGFVGGLLDRLGLRKPAARPPPHAPAQHLPRGRPPQPPPIDPLPEPQAAVPKDGAQSEEERALAELRRSFQHGILDARFRDDDVDQRFLEDFARLLASSAEPFTVPPAAAFDVMRIVDDPNYPVKKVAAAIACDPALAGSVVSLANSALHRGAVAVETLADAIVRVGQRHLRLLLLEIALGTARVKARPYETLSDLTWKHSLLTAQLAHLVAKAAGQDVGRAYMAGLFHDVGNFAVLSAARRLATRQERRITPQTLLKLVEAHSRELDERVVSGWRLPEDVAAAVRHRRDPAAAGDAAPLAAVIAIANDLSRPLGAWVAARPVDFRAHGAVETLSLDPANLPDEKAILGIARKIEQVAGLH